ncbi:MAG: hypothetical protein QOD99_1094 [Chthoniobacter sp.]|jgi:hypothetical protein|nr:hypothetical protein [Chthoniobacter sp.]
MRRFSNDDSPYAKDMETFYINYGLTVHIAQELEKSVAVLLLAAERHGFVEIDREATKIRKHDDLLNLCLGRSVRILHESGSMDRELAPYSGRRTTFVTSWCITFISDNLVELTNTNGREATNEALWTIHCQLRKSLNGVNAIKNKMIADIPEWQAHVEQQLAELKKDIPERDVDL